MRFLLFLDCAISISPLVLWTLDFGCFFGSHIPFGLPCISGSFMCRSSRSPTYTMLWTLGSSPVIFAIPAFLWIFVSAAAAVRSGYYHLFTPCVSTCVHRCVFCRSFTQFSPFTDTRTFYFISFHVSAFVRFIRWDHFMGSFFRINRTISPGLRLFWFAVSSFAFLLRHGSLYLFRTTNAVAMPPRFNNPGVRIGSYHAYPAGFNNATKHGTRRHFRTPTNGINNITGSLLRFSCRLPKQVSALKPYSSKAPKPDMACITTPNNTTMGEQAPDQCRHMTINEQMNSGVG